MRLDRIGVENGLPRIAERRVHRVRQRVHDRRLTFAGDDDARAAMCVEIVANRGDPRLRVGRQRAAAIDAGDAEVGGQRARQQLNLARLQRQAMVRLRARRRRHRLCRVQPAAGAFGPPSRRELPRVAEMAGAAAEEIGVEHRR